MAPRLPVWGVGLGKQRIGHYGLTAVVLAGLAILALILHLATPYANVSFENDFAGQSDETFSRKDVARDFDVLSDHGPNVSPGLTLAGLIIAVVGASALAVLGFVPLRIEPARWLGWGSGVVTAVGASMAFVSSMWWVGSGFGLHTVMPSLSQMQSFPVMEPFGPMQEGFTFLFAAFGMTGGLSGLLEVLWQSDSGTTVWIISPALVAPLALAAIVLALRVCGNVAAQKDGIRERTQRHLRGSLFAMIFVGVVLLVPWAIGETTDSTGQDEDFFAYGAHTILNMEDLSDGEVFGHMAYALNVMVVTGWIGFAFGIVGSAGGILASTGVPAPVSRAFHFSTLPTAIMFAWSFLVYLLAWIYMWRPFEDAEGFQPGYFPIALAVVFVLWGINQYNLLTGAVGTLRATVTTKTQAVSFE